MKSPIKLTILSLVCLFALVFAGPEKAQAQAMSSMLSTTGGVTNIAANTLVFYTNNVVPVNKASTFALGATVKLAGSGTTGITFIFDTSLDNANWQSNVITWTVAPAGNASVTTITNVTSLGWNYIRLSSATNGSASALTNLYLKVSQPRAY